jgi:hypothetical protein
MSPNLRSGSVGTQFAFLPVGAFAPKERSIEPSAFFRISWICEERLARGTPLTWVSRS